MPECHVGARAVRSGGRYVVSFLALWFIRADVPASVDGGGRGLLLLIIHNFLSPPPMQHNSEAENRTLDAQCGSKRTVPSRTAVTKLKAMSLDDKTLCMIIRYAKADLGNLVRWTRGRYLGRYVAGLVQHDTAVLCSPAR